MESILSPLSSQLGGRSRSLDVRVELGRLVMEVSVGCSSQVGYGMKSYFTLIAMCGVVLLALGWGLGAWVFRDRVSAGEAAQSAKEGAVRGAFFEQRDREADVDGPTDPQQNWRQQIVGTWEMKDDGSRRMTLDNDGTGVMEVTLTGAIAALYAQRLRFDLRWSIEQGKLVRECIGGEPAEKVELILRAMGRRTEDVIEVVSPRQLRTLGTDGVTTSTWERIR